MYSHELVKRSGSRNWWAKVHFCQGNPDEVVDDMPFNYIEIPGSEGVNENSAISIGISLDLFNTTYTR